MVTERQTCEVAQSGEFSRDTLSQTTVSQWDGRATGRERNRPCPWDTQDQWPRQDIMSRERTVVRFIFEVRVAWLELTCVEEQSH